MLIKFEALSIIKNKCIIIINVFNNYLNANIFEYENIISLIKWNANLIVLQTTTKFI